MAEIATLTSRLEKTHFLLAIMNHLGPNSSQIQKYRNSIWWSSIMFWFSRNTDGKIQHIWMKYSTFTQSKKLGTKRMIEQMMMTECIPSFSLSGFTCFNCAAINHRWHRQTGGGRAESSFSFSASTDVDHTLWYNNWAVFHVTLPRSSHVEHSKWFILNTWRLELCPPATDYGSSLSFKKKKTVVFNLTECLKMMLLSGLIKTLSLRCVAL